MEEKLFDGNRVGQEQFYDLLLSRELSWQEIIYDLISSEQLDPWDIDLSLLAQKYLERIRELEELSFFISSKVLFAASLLLRIKSELLLDRYIKGLDEILFGKPPEREKGYERVFLDEELPDLLPKTPLPRSKKVTLQELMQALEKAMATEHRRIVKEIAIRQAARSIDIILPKIRINLKEKIKELYSKIKNFFKSQPTERLTFSILAGAGRENRIATFVPLLHLDSQEKILLEQERHFEEIFILLHGLTPQPQEMDVQDTQGDLQQTEQQIGQPSN